MTTKTLFPTLSTDAWVNSPIKAADYLISHFFLAEYSQTATFPEDVASFTWLIQRYQGDITQLITETERMLSKYFSTQFSDVEVQITEKDIDGSINKKGITLYLVFTDMTGTKHNLARAIQYTGLTINEIIAVQTGG